jgi:hypothetical protein
VERPERDEEAVWNAAFPALACFLLERFACSRSRRFVSFVPFPGFVPIVKLRSREKLPGLLTTTSNFFDSRNRRIPCDFDD